MDMALAVLCMLMAYVLRMDVPVISIEAFRSDPSFQPWLPLILFAPFVRVFTFNMFGVYDDNTMKVHSAQNIYNLCKAVTLGSVVLIVAAFMYRGFFDYRQFSYARLIPVYDWFLTIILVTATHALLTHLRIKMLLRGIGQKRMGIQGTGHLSGVFLNELKQFPLAGYRVMGYISPDSEKNSFEDADSFKYLGDTDHILDIINTYSLNEIVVTDVDSLGMELVQFVEECHKRDVVVKLALDFYGILMQARKLDELAGQPVIQINEIAIQGLARVLKRLEDITLCSIALMITFPVWVVISLLIKRESPGPAIFAQTRVGKNGRTFTMYKFRSMVADADAKKEELMDENEADGLIFKMKNDPRITRIGRFIRRTNLDEIPQFINVLKGDMSLVGPRPPVPSEVAQYTEPQKRRLGATPGITGLWQVNRGHQHSFEEVLNWDTYYIENWSLWLDIKIIFKTFGVVLNGKASY
jgi:exopolysaccharide biosynthesis polyprenyl glycosylphosphotransferase